MNQAAKKLFACFLALCMKEVLAAAGSRAVQFAARGAPGVAGKTVAGRQPFVGATPQRFLNLVDQAGQEPLGQVAKNSLLFEYQNLMAAQNIAVPQDIQEGLRKQQDVTPKILAWLKTHEGLLFLEQLAEFQVEEEAAREALFEQEEEERRVLEQTMLEVPTKKEELQFKGLEQQIKEARERKEREHGKEIEKREQEANIQALAEKKIAERLPARQPLLQLIDLVAGKKEPGFESAQVQKQLDQIAQLKQQGFTPFIVVGIQPKDSLPDEVTTIPMVPLSIGRQSTPVFIVGIQTQYIPVIAQTYSQFADANMRSFDFVINPELSLISQGDYRVPAKDEIPELVVRAHLMNSLDDIFTILQNAKEAQLQQQQAQEQQELSKEEARPRQEYEKEQEALLKEAQKQEQQARLLAREAELEAEERMLQEERQELQTPRESIAPSVAVESEEGIKPEEITKREDVMTQEALQEPKGIQAAKKEYREYTKSRRQEQAEKRVAQKEKEKKERKEKEVIGRALQALQKEKSQLIEQLKQAQKKNNELNSQNAMMRDEVASAKKTLEEKALQQEEERKALENRFKEQDAQATNKIAEQKRQFEGEIEQLTKKFTDLQESVKRLNEQNEQLLREHVQELAGVIDQAQQDKNVLQEEHDKALERLRNAQADALKKLQEEQQSQIDAIRAERDAALKTADERQQALQRLQEDLRAQTANSATERLELARQVASLKAEKADQDGALKSLRVSIDTLRTDLSAAQQERLRAQEDSARKDVRIQSLEAQVASSQDLFGQQEDLVRSLQNENQELVATMQSLKEQMEADGVRMRKETADAIAQAKTQFAALQDDQDALFQQQQSKAQEREKALEQELRAAQDVIARQKDRQVLVEQENARLKEQVQAQEREKDGLRNQMAQDKEQQLTRTIALQQEAEKQKDQFKVEKRDLQARNRELQADKEQLAAQVRALREEVEKHEEELHILRQANLEQLDNVQAQYQQDKEAFDAERARLEGANQQLLAQKRTSQEALEAKEVLIQKAENANKELREKLDAQQREADHAIQAMRTQQEKQFDQYKAAMQKEQKEIVEQRDRIIEERDAIENNVKALEQAVVQSAAEKEQKEQAIDALKAQMDQENAQARINQEELEGRLNILLQAQQDMRLKNQAEKESFIAQIKRFEEQKAQLDALVNDLRAQGVTLSKKHEEELHILRQANLEQLDNVLAPYQQASQVFDAERARLRKEVEDAKQQLLGNTQNYAEERAAKDAQIKRLEQTNKELRSMFDAQQREADHAIQVMRTQLEDRFNQYKAAMEKEQKEIAEQRDRIVAERDAIKSKVEALEQAIAQSAAEKEQKERSIKLLQEQLKRLQTSIDVQEQRFESMQSVAMQKSSLLLDQVAQSFAQKDALAQEKMRQLQDENGATQLQLKDARQELQNISMQIKSLETALKKAQDQVRQSKQEVVEMGIQSDPVLQRFDVVSKDLTDIQSLNQQLDLSKKQIEDRLDGLENQIDLQSRALTETPQVLQEQSQGGIKQLNNVANELQEQSATKESELLLRKDAVLKEVLPQTDIKLRDIKPRDIKPREDRTKKSDLSAEQKRELREKEKEKELSKDFDTDKPEMPKRTPLIEPKKGGSDEKDRERERAKDRKQEPRDERKVQDREQGVPIIYSKISREMPPETVPIIPPEDEGEDEDEDEKEEQKTERKKISLAMPQTVARVARRRAPVLQKEKKAFASAQSQYKGYVSKPYISPSQPFAPRVYPDQSDIRPDEDLLPDKEPLLSEPSTGGVEDESTSNAEPAKQVSKQPSIPADKTIQEQERGFQEGTGVGSRGQSAFKKYWKTGIWIGLALFLIELLRRMR